MAENPPPSPPQFPSPEELKSKITDFMKQNFGDHVSVATITEPEPAVAEEDEVIDSRRSRQYGQASRDWLPLITYWGPFHVPWQENWVS